MGITDIPHASHRVCYYIIHCCFMPIDNTNANLSMRTSSTDGPSSLAADIMNRQKCTVPSRSRRGGPALGNCEMDNLILEMKRRKCASELCPRTHLLIFFLLQWRMNLSFLQIRPSKSHYKSGQMGGQITVMWRSDDACSLVADTNAVLDY